MTLQAQIFDALKALVNNEVRPDEFRQNNKQEVQVPAIRFTLTGGDVFPDLCGVIVADSNPRYQFDVVHRTAAERDALVTQVHGALAAFVDPPCILEGLPFDQRDPETKLYRSTFFYTFYPS